MNIIRQRWLQRIAALEAEKKKEEPTPVKEEVIADSIPPKPTVKKTSTKSKKKDK